MNLPNTLSIAVLSLAALSGCNDQAQANASFHAAAAAADPTTPGGAMTIALADLKTGNFSSFFARVTPTSRLVEMEAQWNKFCSHDMSTADASEFNQFMNSMTVAGSELLLFEKVKPSLEQAQQQLQALASMGPTLAASALDEVNVEAEAGLAAMQAMASTLGDIDIGSAKKAKEAIALACRAARNLRVSNAHAFQRLGFEEALNRVDVLYVAIMDVMDVYDVPLRDSIRSMQARTVAEEGDTAYMELSMKLFGKRADPIPFEMARVNGRWELVLESQVAE